MKGTKDNTGKVITEDDRVYVFKVSSPKRPNGSFYSQPNFNKEIHRRPVYARQTLNPLDFR